MALSRPIPNKIVCKKVRESTGQIFWLVVSTPLKNISQWEGLSHTLWKIKKMKPPTSIVKSCEYLDGPGKVFQGSDQQGLAPVALPEPSKPAARSGSHTPEGQLLNSAARTGYGGLKNLHVTGVSDI